MESSTQKGFGSVVSLLPGRVIILQTTPGTPSQKAGLAPGDDIVAVNGYVIARLDVDQIAELLTQSRQQQVQLDVRRPGALRIMHFVLTPEELQAPSVERAYMLRDGIGYVRVASFDEKTGGQIKEAIEKLGGDKLKGLVLDLRNNPGGVVAAALQTAALFLKPGQKIFSVRGRGVSGEGRIGSGKRHALYFQDGGAGERKIRQRFGDCHRRAAGSRPRHRARRAELRQGSGAKRLSA